MALKTLAVHSDTNACGNLRIIWPTQILKRRGHGVRTAGGVNVMIGDDGYIRHIRGEVDVMVLQRPISRVTANIVEAAQRQGIYLVVEVDDDFGALPKDHPAHRMKTSEYSPYWLGWAARRADWVVCTTEALAERYGAHGRVSIVPNYVHERHLGAPGAPRGDRLRIGWPGAALSHPGDLEVVGDGVARAVVDLDAEFVAFGTENEAGLVHDLLQIPQSHRQRHGWCRQDDWTSGGYAAALRSLDITICPLELSPFTQSKSWLKPLEAAAVGSIPVMSPTAPYIEFRKRFRAGELCGTPDEWHQALIEARPDPSMIAESVQDQHLGAHAHEFLEAWQPK